MPYFLKPTAMEQEKKQMISDYVAAYNAFDVDGMLTHLHADVRFQNVSSGEVNLTTEGIHEFAAQAEAAKAYFKERQQSITAWHFTDETVTVDIAYSGRLAIDLPNGMKAGDMLELKGQSIFEFSEGKIRSITDLS